MAGAALAARAARGRSAGGRLLQLAGWLRVAPRVCWLVRSCEIQEGAVTLNPVPCLSYLAGWLRVALRARWLLRPQRTTCCPKRQVALVSAALLISSLSDRVLMRSFVCPAQTMVPANSAGSAQSLVTGLRGSHMKVCCGSSPLESTAELAAMLPRSMRDAPALGASAGLLGDPAQGFTGCAARITVALDDAVLPASWGAKAHENPAINPSSRCAPRAAYWVAYQLPGRRGSVTTGAVSAEPVAGSDGVGIRVMPRHADEHWVRPQQPWTDARNVPFVAGACPVELASSLSCDL